MACAMEVDQADMVEGARDGLLVCEVRNDLERPSALLEGCPCVLTPVAFESSIVKLTA